MVSLLPVEATAVASVAYINQGVYFIRGHFVDIPSSYLILDQYTNSPSYRVGLEVSESIVTPEDDPTLNDNAAGTSNYSAPVVIDLELKQVLSRKQLTTRLIKTLLNCLDLTTLKLKSLLHLLHILKLEKSLARRTYEESGDYVIDTFTITPRENLDDGFNNGVYRPWRDN